MRLHPCKAKRISKMNLLGNRPILEIHSAAGNINPSRQALVTSAKNLFKRRKRGSFKKVIFKMQKTQVKIYVILEHLFLPLYEAGITKALQSLPQAAATALQPVPLRLLKDFPSYSQVKID